MRQANLDLLFGFRGWLDPIHLDARLELESLAAWTGSHDKKVQCVANGAGADGNRQYQSSVQELDDLPH